jgi:tartrate dehydratase beta subunit/fumarate hydratase class I family protein
VSDVREDSFDEALKLLPPRADWRRLTDVSISVYAASPYNAKAQVRYDGYGPTIAAQMRDAIAKMQAAIDAKASVAKARGDA